MLRSTYIAVVTWFKQTNPLIPITHKQFFTWLFHKASPAQTIPGPCHQLNSPYHLYFHKQRARLARNPNQSFNTTSSNTNFIEPAPSIASTTPSPPTNLTHSHHADAVNGYCRVSRPNRSYLPSTTRQHISITRPSVLDPNLAQRRAGRWPVYI